MSFLVGSSPLSFHQRIAVSAPVAGSPESMRMPVQPASQSGAFFRKPSVP